jgi:hypothetical protein
MANQTVDAKQQQLEDDFHWALDDPQVQRRHGGQTVVVHRRRVCGAGQNLAEAWEDAQGRLGCPPRDEVVFVPVPLLVAEPGSEYGWCLEDEQIQERHAGLVAAVRGSVLWGSGLDRRAALAEATRQPGCPPEEELTFVLIPTVSMVTS